LCLPVNHYGHLPIIISGTHKGCPYVRIGQSQVLAPVVLRPQTTRHETQVTSDGYNPAPRLRSPINVSRNNSRIARASGNWNLS